MHTLKAYILFDLCPKLELLSHASNQNMILSGSSLGTDCNTSRSNCGCLDQVICMAIILNKRKAKLGTRIFLCDVAPKLVNLNKGYNRHALPYSSNVVV